MLLGAACLFSGCAGNSGTTPRDARSMRGTIVSATSVELFEGLPHQMFERDMLEHEKRTQSTITLDNFSFYSTPLEVSDADNAWIRAWIASDANLVAFGGEKKCGGFHPDYCVV